MYLGAGFLATSVFGLREEWGRKQNAEGDDCRIRKPVDEVTVLPVSSCLCGAGMRNTAGLTNLGTANVSRYPTPHIYTHF